MEIVINTETQTFDAALSKLKEAFGQSEPDPKSKKPSSDDEGSLVKPDFKGYEAYANSSPFKKQRDPASSKKNEVDKI